MTRTWLKRALPGVAADLGEESKVFLLWFGTFFVIVISVIEGVYNFDVNILRTARNLEASEIQIFWYVLLPGVLGTTADKLVSYFIRNYFLRYRRGEEVSI